MFADGEATPAQENSQFPAMRCHARRRRKGALRTLYARAFRFLLSISSMSARAGTSEPKLVVACVWWFGVPSSMAAVRVSWTGAIATTSWWLRFGATVGEERVGRRV